MKVSARRLFGAHSLDLPACAKPEERLTSRLADFLRLAAPPDLFFCHIPNEAPRHVVGHAIQEAMGRQTGMSDLHLLFRGRAFYVEVKVKGKKPDDNQLEVMRRLVEAGGRCAVIYTLEDFIAQVRAWGIVTS